METGRPPRADATRNRARVLAVAHETMASAGLSVPIDEIARRAGVGSGTVYRHFPSKDALFGAVIQDRLQQMTTTGRTLLECGQRDALHSFIKSMVTHGAADVSLAQAMAGQGIDMNVVAPHAEAGFLGLLADLLAAAQQAGTARPDVTVPEVKTLIVGAQAMHRYNAGVAERVTDFMLDGLRPSATI
jgi:AcrR family transcriptional regulator